MKKYPANGRQVFTSSPKNASAALKKVGKGVVWPTLVAWGFVDSTHKASRARYRVPCWMWEHRTDMKEAEGCCIERATASDYIHDQMSNHVTNRVM
jgi:hypothetical protein